jgi:RNA polymerase sigma-70 factor (ECF subfamily)
LIKNILKGDVEKYGELMRLYNQKVLGSCLSMLHNRSEAEEAAQDIFTKAYHNLAKFQGNSSFSTWLYRITTNHCLDILRKRNRRRTTSLDALVESEGDHIEAIFATSRTALTTLESKDLVDKILSALPEDYRTILTLREAQGLEYQEIAEILDCSLDAVKGRLSRARKALQEHLQHFIKNENVLIKEGDR